EPMYGNICPGKDRKLARFAVVSFKQKTAYEIYKKPFTFPEGTIMFKDLQLTLPGQNPDGSRTEPSGRGYFPGPFNGGDATVKDTKRYADTGGWGDYDFNHHEPKAPTAKVRAKEECAFCHMASAKKDQVWNHFYPLSDIGMPNTKCSAKAPTAK